MVFTCLGILDLFWRVDGHEAASSRGLDARLAGGDARDEDFNGGEHGQ